MYTSKYFFPFLQLSGTLVILFLIPNTILQTLLLLTWWSVTFLPLTREEWVLVLIACIVYTGADFMVIHRGIFHFVQNDLLQMPYYEPFMWGFYFLHAKRLLGGTTLHSLFPGMLFASAFLASLSLFSNVTFTLVATGVVISIAFIFFHTKYDFLYAGYFALIGILIEFLGTSIGIWTYDIQQYPWWWVLTWAASGIILYRVMLPLSTHVAAMIRQR